MTTETPAGAPSSGHKKSPGLRLLRAGLARPGLALALPRPRLTPGVRRLGGLMLPLAFTAGALQLNLLIGTMIATLQTGAAAWLYYADRIYQLPLGVVGVAVGTALLPMLARSLRAGDAAAAKASQSRALEVSLLLTLPAPAAPLALAWPFAQVRFARGPFRAAASARPAAVGHPTAQTQSTRARVDGGKDRCSSSLGGTESMYDRIVAPVVVSPLIDSK